MVYAVRTDIFFREAIIYYLELKLKQGIITCM